MTDKPEDFPKLTAKQLRQKQAEIRADRRRIKRDCEFYEGAIKWLKNRFK